MSRVIIRPPGHSGKAKRGHLCFDAAFETGNLGRADLVGEFEYGKSNSLAQIVYISLIYLESHFKIE